MTQKRALELMRSGANIFLSGPPGSGKSFVLERFMQGTKRANHRVAVTASTGIAASLLGGVTIHSWSGIRAKQHLSQVDIEGLLKDASLTQRLRSADILIIDEISMLDGATLDTLDVLLKMARQSAAAFGGVQLILSGDFFQLPPVSHIQPAYCFLARSWAEASLKVCYLSEQHRQDADELSDILMALRERRFSKNHLELLSARQGIPHQPTTMLMTHNRDVDSINHQRLEALSGQLRSYYAKSAGQTDITADLTRSVLAPQVLDLKIGAAVMFVANDTLRRYVNGSQAKVIGYKFGLPLVELKGSGKTLVVEAFRWTREADKSRAELIQLPLKLAWAVTIHKCQGMSLDMADIDLKRSFTFGMGYVALSRLTSYKGLYLSSYNSRSLQLDQAIYEFDLTLQRSSKLNETSVVISQQDKLFLALFGSGMAPALIKQSLGISERQLQASIKRLNHVSK